MILRTRQKRFAAATVELAAVVIVFTMLMFGILEYCRYIFTQNIVQNAAREGCRYAVVNANDSTMVSDTQAYVLTVMDGLNVQDAPYACSVYMADTSGNNIGAATSAKFGQYICCDVSITYVPVTPGLLYMKTVTIRSKCCMISEAN